MGESSCYTVTQGVMCLKEEMGLVFLPENSKSCNLTTQKVLLSFFPPPASLCHQSHFVINAGVVSLSFLCAHP